MADEQGDEYICPACSAPVEPDWQACPSCGVTFDPPEPEGAGAPAEADAGTSLDDLEAEILGAPSAAPAEPDPIAELEQEISAAVAPGPDEKAPPPAEKGPPAARPKGLVGRLGGRLGTAGVGLLAAGAVGALVGLNYDTWVRGQSTSAVGALQQTGILTAGALAAVGLVLWLVGGGKLKRKGTRAV